MGRCILGPNGWECPPITSASGFELTKITEAELPDADTTNIGTAYMLTDVGNKTVYNFDGVTWEDITPPLDAAASAYQSSVWASRGSGDYVGHIKRITDICSAYGGSNPNVLAIWDGTYWQPLGGIQEIVSLRAAVSGAAAATSTPADQTMSINAGLLNIYGGLLVDAAFTTANVQTVTFLPKCNFGGSTTFDGSTSMGTKKVFRFVRNIRNSGAANVQKVLEASNADDGMSGTSGNQSQDLAINTANAADLVVGGSATHATSITCTLSKLRVFWRR